MRGVVTMLVPIQGERRLIFTQWLPSEETMLRAGAGSGELPVMIWADYDCLDHIAGVEPEDVPKHINLMVNKLHVSVALGDVTNELVEYIEQGRGLRRDNPDPELDRQYEELGAAVHESTVCYVNRLLEYARVEKGQYWVPPVQHDTVNRHSFFNSTKATVLFGDRSPVRWAPPPYVFHVNVVMGGEHRYLSEQDWVAAGAYLNQRGRPNLVKELLAKSELLIDESYCRAAVVESVVALEIALNRFFGSPAVDRLADRAQGARIDLDGLPRLREKLGLRGAISYLLPLVLDEEMLPGTLLDSIRSAVDLRGNIVHNGQRDVDDRTARTAVAAIRKACALLAELTWDSAGGPA